MFLFKKKPVQNRQLSAEQLAALSDFDLYSLFLPDSFASLDSDTRLRSMQEVENRRARLDGRTPIPVRKGDGDVFVQSKNLMGGYDREKKVILLNYRCLTGSSSMYGGLAMLNTILHEGRHACQHDMIERRPKELSAQVLREWIANHRFNITPLGVSGVHVFKIRALYLLQSVEMDARRFARRQMQAYADAFTQAGKPVPSDLKKALQWAQNEEIIMIQLVRASLTDSELTQLEALIQSKIKEKYPDLNCEGLRLFDHARLILDAKIKKVSDYTDLIAKLDKMADEHMDRSLDRPEWLDRAVPERIREERSLL